MQEDYNYLFQTPERNYSPLDDFTLDLIRKRDRSDNDSYFYESSSDDSVSSSSSEETPAPRRIGIKSSTEYCYMRNFYLFWKWLYENYPNIVVISPPDKILSSFEDLKIHPQSPINIHNLTPEILFKYSGTKDMTKFTRTTTQLRQPLRNIANIFGIQSDYNELVSKIEAFKTSKKVDILPMSKRKCIRDNDHSPKKVIVCKKWESACNGVIFRSTFCLL